jgi:hypothetical protein
MMGKFSPDLIEGQLVRDRGYYRWKKCAQAMLRTLLPEIPLVRSCHEFNIAGPKQWPHTHALGAMYAGGPV